MCPRSRLYQFGSLLLTAIVACGPTTPEKEPTPCLVEAPTECTVPAPRWADVAPIFEKNCASSSCHDGQPDSPWPLDTYEHVADWWDVIRDELLSCSMPPPDSGKTVPPEEIDTILVWIRCGFPE